MKTSKIRTLFKNTHRIFRSGSSYRFICNTGIKYTYSNFTSVSHIVHFNNQTLNYIILPIDLLLEISGIYIFLR